MFSPCRKIHLQIVLVVCVAVLTANCLLACKQMRHMSSRASADVNSIKGQPVSSRPVFENTVHSRGVLRVCSDPNNLPFSNQKRQGFENKIALIIAKDLKVKVEYVWWAQRRGFIRNTLNQGLCDIVIGIPSSSELALTTKPYYRSTFVFVSRRDRPNSVVSFDDKALTSLRVGIQLIGDDFANTPPAHALTNRHIIQNVRAYSIYGDYGQPNPPARIVEAVARKEIDVAIVWGPLAGYFSKEQPTPLRLVPVSPQIDLPYLPFVYDISMGVRRTDQIFKEKLDEIIDRRQDDINRVLDEYGVPRVGPVPTSTGL